MKSLHIFACIVPMLICTIASAQQQQTRFYVERSSGNKMYAENIEADDSGNLVLHMQGGAKSRLRPGQYKRVSTPRPAIIAQIQTAFKKNEFKKVIELSESAFKKYGWLGWGGLITYYEGLAHLRQKDIAKAEAAFKKGEKPARVGNPKYADLTIKGLIESMLMQEKYSDAEGKLKRLRKTKDNMPFLYKASGRVLKGKGKPEEAKYAYLKVIMLYPKAGPDRKDAYERLIEILKKAGDIRWKTFEQEMKKEFG